MGNLKNSMPMRLRKFLSHDVDDALAQTDFQWGKWKIKFEDNFKLKLRRRGDRVALSLSALQSRTRVVTVFTIKIFVGSSQ